MDGLNFLTGKDLKFLCEQARLGTRLAHVDGGVPNLTIQVAKADAYHVGGLLYFFELANAICAVASGVDPLAPMQFGPARTLAGKLLGKLE